MGLIYDHIICSIIVDTSRTPNNMYRQKGHEHVSCSCQNAWLNTERLCWKDDLAGRYLHTLGIVYAFPASNSSRCGVNKSLKFDYASCSISRDQEQKSLCRLAIVGIMSPWVSC